MLGCVIEPTVIHATWFVITVMPCGHSTSHRVAEPISPFIAAFSVPEHVDAMC